MSAFAIGDTVVISRDLGELRLEAIDDDGRTVDAVIVHGLIGTVVAAADDIYSVDFDGLVVDNLPLSHGGLSILEPAPDDVDPVDRIFGIQDDVA